MKIKRLDLLAFGPFTNKSLDLSEGKPGLHVIQGPNEAGKSSTLRALKAWLFGIDARSTDNFIHDHKQLRVGGVLETSDEKEISCVRRKGIKGTLLDSVSGDAIGDDTLSKLLPGLNEQLFSQLHGIDHVGLVQGGKAILDQNGDLAKSLFGAALGTQGKAALLDELASEADKLFKSKGQIQTINAAIAKLRDAKREEKQQLVPVSDWKDLQKSLKDTEEVITKIDAELAEANCSKSKLERFRRVAGSLAERRELLADLNRLTDAALLSEDFGFRRLSALDKLSSAKERLQKTTNKLDAARSETVALVIPNGLLENQEGIEELQLQLGAFQKALIDKPAQDAKRRTHRNAALNLLKGIRPDLELDSAEALRPQLNKKRLIATLTQESNLLKQDFGHLDARLRELSEEKTAIQQQLDALSGPGKNVASLQSAILTARKSGDLTEMLNKARNAASQQEEACSRDLQRLGRFSGSLEELVNRPMPEKAVVDRFENKFNDLGELVREASRHQAEIDQKIVQHSESLKVLLRSRMVPSFEDLHRARSRREHGWKLLRGMFLDGAAPGAEAKEYAGANNLPGAYEQAVLDADNVADKLRTDAQQVQERILLETQIRTGQEQLSKLQINLNENKAAQSELDIAWKAEWDGIASKVGTPKEMREWLQRAEQLLQKATLLSEARAAVLALEAKQASHLNVLSAELKKLDQQPAHETEALDAVLTRCDQFVSQQETATRLQNELRNSLQKVELQLKGVADSHRQLEDKRSRWEASWAAALDGLGLAANPHPELVLATMESLELLFGELKEADAAHKRIYGMEKDEERFRAGVNQLAQRISLDIGVQSPEVVAQSMTRRLAQALADAATLKKIGAQIQDFEDEIADIHAESQTAEQTLAALRVEAGASDDADLVRIVERSQQKRLLDARLQEVQKRLNQSGDGRNVGELESEARELDADHVEDALQKLNGSLSDLATSRDTKRDQRKALLVKIEALDGSSKAAEAAEKYEQLLPAIVADAEQYLRLTIARLILEEQIERYRQQNQTPVLKRAGELFSKLTLGSFSGLRDEIDEKGKPILLGVRPDKSEIGVDSMSDGTRDQLFLALRLATIELQGDRQDPVPFVVDDILMTYDDKRTKACLDVLAEFARTTQVLVFTHHSMVAKSAGEIGRGKGVFVHELAVS